MQSEIELETDIQVIENDSWFKEWFASDYYVKLYVHRDRAEAEACIDLIVDSIDLPDDAHPRPRALDVASGPGRHAITLAGRGFDVTAVDLSPTLIAYAAQTARSEGATGIDFELHDMRELPYHDEFDLAVQLFTSFGYFESHAEDELVLRRVRSALRDGGYYALDLINERRLHQTLVPRSVRRLEDIEVIEERRIEGDRVIKEITIRGEDGREHHYAESVRLFSPEQIDRMLRAAGFVPEQWFGDYHGADYDADTSDRMLIISRAA
jgi:SAM-dependent methyltransferase